LLNVAIITHTAATFFIDITINFFTTFVIIAFNHHILSSPLYLQLTPYTTLPHSQTCSVSQKDIMLIIGVSVGVGGFVIIACACYWYIRCRRSGAERRYASYEANVKKQKQKLAERSEERKTTRQERESEIRGKYGLFKDKEDTGTRQKLLSGSDSYGAKY
jgi:hypothetical protein